jgi:Family of unknown function (DUF5309)
MPEILGQGTTFNLPNYVGELFQVTPSDTPLLSAIGGLTGGRQADKKQFEWQTFDLRDPKNPDNLEGQDAPQASHRVRQNIQNTVQIFHEAVDISYTKQSTPGQRNGLPGNNPVQNEMSWQVEQHLKQIARDVEYTFINGVYAYPSDNSAPRKTRGLLDAIATNVVALDDGAGGPAALTETAVLDLMQEVWSNGGIQEQETATLVCNAGVKRQLSTIFITDKNYKEQTRNVAGVNVQTIETDFGRVNIMLNRYMPSDQLAVSSLDVLAPRFLYVPGKGFLFEEPLAKTGASDKAQIYGEIGLEYGAEIQHGKIINIANN